MSNPNPFGYPPGYPQPGVMPGALPGAAAAYPGAPAQAPQGYYAPAQAPAQARGNGRNEDTRAVDIDGATDSDERYPRLPEAGRLPWYLTLHSCKEIDDYNADGQRIFWVHATIVQPPQHPEAANFQAGTVGALKIGKIGDKQMNAKALARVKSFLAAISKVDPNAPQAAGFWAARRDQALAGAFTNAPFAATLQAYTPKQAGRQITFLPSFQIWG